MADFINSVDVLGDDAVTNSIIDRSITSYSDSNIINIGVTAFRFCSSLTIVDVPSITNIYADAFRNCSALVTLILRNTEQVVILSGTSALASTLIESGTGYIYAPRALVDTYKAATNWSTFVNQFRAIEDWSVDGTVTGELDIENRAMVRFFNDDGTLLGYSVVTKGSNATYNGTPVCSEDAFAEFLGFEPVPTNVTADMDCYATYKMPISWSDVFAYIADGTYKNKLAIGDTVPLNLGTEGTVRMEVVAFDTDTKADGSGKAPITWIAKEILLTEKVINSTSISNAYWPNHEMQGYLDGTVMSLMPEEVRNAIVPVTKYFIDQQATGTPVTRTFTPSVWIPLCRELNYNVGTGTRDPVYKNAYPTIESRIKKNQNGTIAYYWTRTPSSGSKYFAINSAGKDSKYDTTVAIGVVIGFCT